MSIPLIVPLVIHGYGLKDEDLDEIIVMENLKDISQNYLTSIDKVKMAFGSETRIRLIEFNEISGGNRESNLWYQKYIFAKRHVFYTHLHSNKNCCVLFKYGGFKPSGIFETRIIPHEFGHHFQFVPEGFPAYLPKKTPEELCPQFSRTVEIGPAICEVYIDGIKIDDNPIITIKDFSERIADSICEGIIWEKGFKQGIIQQYKQDIKHDPAKDVLPAFRSQFSAEIRYMRRLSLFDSAEWDAFLSKRFPDDATLKKMLSQQRRWVIKLNKKHDNPKKIYNIIREMIHNTDYRSFKQPKKTIGYVKKAMNLLNIEIRTDENW